MAAIGLCSIGWKGSARPTAAPLVRVAWVLLLVWLLLLSGSGQHAQGKRRKHSRGSNIIERQHTAAMKRRRQRGSVRRDDGSTSSLDFSSAKQGGPWVIDTEPVNWHDGVNAEKLRELAKKNKAKYGVLLPYLSDDAEEQSRALCGSEAPKACQCPRFVRPQIMVNNRVPKCGSATLYKWMFNALNQQQRGSGPCRSCLHCWDTKFMYRDFGKDPRKAERFMGNPFSLCPREMRKIEGKNASLVGGLVSSHQYFTPFGFEEQREHISFVVILRDLPGRCRSRFFFEHEFDRIHFEPNDIHATYPDFDAFLQLNRIGPARPTVDEKSRIALTRKECFSNYATTWFCGVQKTPCLSQQNNWDEKLAEAKRVVAEDYALVGIYPHIWETTWLLNVLFPANTGPLKPPSAHVSPPCEYCKKEKKDWDPPPLTAEQRSLLDERNPHDKALFEFADRVFRAKMFACSKRVLTSNS